MKLPEIHPSQNGYQKSPLTAAAPLVAPPQQRTSFPVDAIPLSPTVILYNLSRFTFGGLLLIRCLRWLLLLLVVVWATGLLPGGRWVSGVWLVLLLALEVWLLRWKRRDFVRFVESPCPTVQVEALNAKAKIPIHATGLFHVENKRQRYTWLPGFYRTFATREHALLCQVTDRSFLKMGRWPESEIGLWYVFFQPATIQHVRWGKLYFGNHARPALAVTYQPQDNTPKRRQDIHGETVYLAFQHFEEGALILADLLQDLPATAICPISSLSTPQ